MYDYRSYLVTISAVFLALAIGLLVGFSYGEDVMIYNQQELIEMLEERLFSQEIQIEEKNEKLQAWEEFREYFWKAFSDQIYEHENENYMVGIVSDSSEFTHEITSVLQKQGINYRAITLKDDYRNYLFNYDPGNSYASVDRERDNLVEDSKVYGFEFLLDLIYEGSWGKEVVDRDEIEVNENLAGELAREELEIKETCPHMKLAPENTLIILQTLNQKNGGDSPQEEISNQESFMEGLIYAMGKREHSRAVVAFNSLSEVDDNLLDNNLLVENDIFQMQEKYLTDEDEEDSFSRGGSGLSLSIVDHAGTFWGKVTLLEVIFNEELEGHYGFKEGSIGILPGKEVGCK